MRLKKKVFYGLWLMLLLVLWVVRLCFPHVAEARAGGGTALPSPEAAVSSSPAGVPSHKGLAEGEEPHRIMSVASYADAFPDLQEVQIEVARRYGVSPVRDREEAERRKGELVYVGSNPYYVIDKRMTASIPYLVPRASRLLQDIGRAFLDSLALKGVPMHKVIVSSVLRTEEDVARLVRRNPNASGESCHRFGTTFDLCYNRYSTVSPPGEVRRAVSNDTLKWVLSEVLDDLRRQGRCYVKYEVKQGCFHITTR